MSNDERTTDTIIAEIADAMRQDPRELEKFLRLTIEDGLGLIVKAEWDSDDIVYTSERLAERLRTWYEPSASDAELIAHEYEIEYSDIDDQFKDELEQLDVWLKFSEYEDAELAEYEANTFRENDGTYRVGWYHNAVGLVTSEYFDTYEEAKEWYEENGFQDFTA